MRHGGNPLTGHAVVLSGDPAREDHELALFSNPGAEHVAFRVATVDQLRSLYDRAYRGPGKLSHGSDRTQGVRPPIK